jgi:hypothetical protein
VRLRHGRLRPLSNHDPDQHNVSTGSEQRATSPDRERVPGGRSAATGVGFLLLAENALSSRAFSTVKERTPENSAANKTRRHGEDLSANCAAILIHGPNEVKVEKTTERQSEAHEHSFIFQGEVAAVPCFASGLLPGPAAPTMHVDSFL